MDPATSEHFSVQTAQLIKQVRRLNSFKWNFALSIVRGVGVTLGATIVTGITITILYNAYLSSVDILPFLETVLPKHTMEQYIDPEMKRR